MERRTEHRYEVWLPVKVDSLKEGIAVTHNVSQGGALMVTASTLEPGSGVSITLRTPDSQEIHKLAGRVVRVEQNSDDPHGLWPHRLAIEFDTPVPELEWILAGLQSPASEKTP